MKIWQAILLAILLAATPVLSACDLLGLGNSQQEREQEYYQQQLEAYQKVQEANRKQQEAYNEQLRQGLEEYYKAWQEHQFQQQMKQLEQLEGMPSANQSGGSESD